MGLSKRVKLERSIAQEQHDRAMEIENAAKVILKEAAEGRLRQTFDDRARFRPPLTIYWPRVSHPLTH